MTQDVVLNGHSPKKRVKRPSVASDAERVLADFPSLRAVAVTGAARIREIAARPIVWLWNELVCDGQIVLIFGAPGGGKTTLLFLLVLARASLAALDVLGRRVEPAPLGKYIVLIEGEHGDGSAMRKLVKTTLIHGLNEAAADAALKRLIVIARKEVRLGTEKWEETKALIATGAVSDLFVDSLVRLAAADGNSEQEQVAVFTEVGEAIEGAPDDVKPTAWIIAHGRKDSSNDVDDVSGSVQRAGQADTIIFVKATKDDDGKVVSSRVSATKLREEPEEWPAAIDFSVAKDDAGKWTCKTGGASARPSETPIQERIATLLAEGPKTKTTIREKLGVNENRFQQGIRVLFKEKRITKREKTIDGRKRDVFALREEKKKRAEVDRSIFRMVQRDE